MTPSVEKPQEPEDRNLLARGLEAVKGIFKAPETAKAVPATAPSSAEPSPAPTPRAPERSERKLDEIVESLQEMNDAISTLSRRQIETYRDAAKGSEERHQRSLEAISAAQRDMLAEIRRTQEGQIERLEQVLASTRANLRIMLFLSFFFLAALAFLLMVVLRLSKSAA